MNVYDVIQCKNLLKIVYNSKKIQKGPFWSTQSQKLKIAFHQFLLIGLLVESLKCKISAFFLNFNVAMVTKMAKK